MLTYHLFVFSKTIKKYVAKKPFKTMNNIPKKVWLNAKNTKHHATFKNPFIKPIINIFLLNKLFFIKIEIIIANKI